MRRLLFSALSLLASLSPASAQFELPTGAPKTKASLVSEVKSIAPEKSFSVALKLEHPGGWHSYYQNSGGVEEAPAIRWTLPDGFKAGPIQWPVPSVKDGFFGKSYVFDGSPVFLVDISAPTTLESGGTVTLKADATWQICKESCINEEQSFTLNLSVGPNPEKATEHASLFEQARASQAAVKTDWKFSATSDGGDVILRVETGAALAEAPVDFIPDQPFVKSVSSGGDIKKEGDAWVFRLPRALKNALEEDLPQGDRFSGVIVATQAVRVPETIIAAAGAAPSPPVESLSFAKLLPVLGSMFLGGLILNLMPCVFPVIGLKIMGFVQQAGSDRKKVALHGVVFAAGVFVSFAILSGILFTIRETTNWGFQLQDPYVVMGLMLLMFVLALNMYGVFEFGTSATSVGGSLQSKQGLGGSFFSGVLATVVATPCSGPYLGAALAAASGLPALQFFTAFGAMALGLALPYLLLSLFPHLIDSLPRPGAWMESFKQGMSFLLFATAGYLLWVYAGLIDLENLLAPIIGLSAIGLAAWIYGRWNLPHQARRTRLTAMALTLLFGMGGILLAKPPKPSALHWEAWSAERVEQLLKDGKPVYIDFTAQWCATCQVNKKRAYTREVVDLMNQKGVVTLKADKTKPNPEIDAALQKLGRNAIPVNVLNAPGKDPIILPELLSPEDVMEALKKL